MKNNYYFVWLRLKVNKFNNRLHHNLINKMIISLSSKNVIIISITIIHSKIKFNLNVFLLLIKIINKIEIIVSIIIMIQHNLISLKIK